MNRRLVRGVRIGVLGVRRALVLMGVMGLFPSMRALAQRAVATGIPERAEESAAEVLLTRPVTVQLVGTTLGHAIDAIASSAGLVIQYRAQVVDAYLVPVTLRVAHVPLRTALERVLAGTGLRAIASNGGKGLTIVPAAVVREIVADGSIEGTVIDAVTKQPLAGVTITVDDIASSAQINQRRGVQTNDRGLFRIARVTPGVRRVTARMLGYVRHVQTITVADGQAVTLVISLEPSANALDQVIVTGTVVATAQREVPNAMTVMTAKDIEQRGITNIDQLFRGDIPGLFVLNQGSANALDAVTMFSRGATALDGSYTNPIKTYVDGIELADPTYLNQIDPKSIERIEIISGPQASTIYGSNAMNGVMQIFTKRGMGAVGKPQLTVSLLSGLVQNNFSPSFTPQHDYAGQVSGTEGRWSYTANAAWNYTGPWTPAKQTARTSGSGGARMSWQPLTVDGKIRRSLTKNFKRGTTEQGLTGNREDGRYAPTASNGRTTTPLLSILPATSDPPATATLDGQTLGMTISYAPWPAWSNEFVVGSDVSDRSTLFTAPGNVTISDTLLQINQTHSERLSFRYATSARIPVTSMAQLLVTGGADRWQGTYRSLFSVPASLTGTLSGSPSITRLPRHNTGTFVQGQLGVLDQLFITYGFRTEWNPNYGDDANPNFAPRYGVAYTREMDTPWGALTAKLRGSYGRATRPPDEDEKLGLETTSPTYGTYHNRLENPELGPEFQQGGEGGLELYLGNRASMVVTRYNQTVDAVIVYTKVDSIQSLVPNSSGNYTYGSIYQYLNLGSIRNQGWELQGTMTTGPFVTKGTYSWTKSRTIGVPQKYRDFLGPAYQPGATFQSFPEHTWALTVSYAKAATTIAFNINGTGYLRTTSDALDLALSSNIRLAANRARMGLPSGYKTYGPGYTIGHLNASHRFSSAVEGVLQVQNIADFYRNDVTAVSASMGRQTKAGVRVRW